MRNILLVILVLILAVSAFAADTASYKVNSPAPTLKVQPATRDIGPEVGSLRIAMAKGEYEPVQVVVTPLSGDLKNLRVDASKLRGPGGAVIPSGRVVVTPLGYINCKKQSPGAVLTGEIPDVELPNRAIDVQNGRHQPFYVTVQTLAEDPAGEYQGLVKIKAENAPEMLLPLTVRVYNLTIPVRSHLKTAFVLREHFRRFTSNKDDHDTYVNGVINYSKVALANRITPSIGWFPKKNDDGSYDFSDFDKVISALIPCGLTTFDVGATGNIPYKYDVDSVKAAAKHFKEKGWWDLHYCYGYDEASGDILQKIPGMYKPLMDAVPDLKIVQTGWNPNLDAVRDMVKIWCPVTQGYVADICRPAQKKGDEIWWYVCCIPPAPYANVFIDSPGIDQRILGWMTYKEGVQGFLYWGLDTWFGNDQSLDYYDKANYANWNPLSFGDTFNGDGSLLYPGKYDSALPSVRLALLRDGFEDYDVFTEAKALADKGGSGAEDLNKLLQFDAPIIKSLTEFTQNGNDLLSRREAILHAAEKLAK